MSWTKRKSVRRYYALLFSLLLVFSLIAPHSALATSEGNLSIGADEKELEKEREKEYLNRSQNNEETTENETSKEEGGLASLMQGLGWEPPPLSGKSKVESSKNPQKVGDDVTKALEKQEKVDVIIRMKERPTVKEIYPQVKAKSKRSEKIKIIKSHLEEKTQTSQKGLKQALKALEQQGKAKKKQSFWIINGLSATVSKDALEQLKKRDDIERISLDRTLQLPEVTVDENPPKLPQWGLEKIRAPKVWGQYGLKGDGVVVGIMDSGVDMTHEALRHNYRGNDGNHQYSWIDLSGQGYETPQDGHGHGTHVAGTAVGGGEGDPIGVAPEAEWIAAKIFTDGGSTTTSAIHAAFQWFMAPGGDPSKAPDVVNNSWGNSNTYSTEFYEDVEAWVAAGIFPNFAAGNDGPGSQTIGAPGSFPQSFAVGATDIYDQVASFSSRGPVFWEDENGNQIRLFKPDVSAPGHQIYSAWPVDLGEGKYVTISGTSMATPHVTGAIALLEQANPDLTVEEVKNLLKSTTRVEPHMGSVPNDLYGRGIVNIYQAVTEAAFSGELKGTLTNQEGEPVSGTLKIADENTEYDIGEDGVVDFKIREGSHGVILESFGYQIMELNLEITRGETTNVTWELERADSYAVQGQVVHSDSGEGVAFSYVQIKNTPIPIARTDENGNFNIEHVPVGTYTLQVSGEGIKGVEQRLNVDADQTLQIEVQSKPSQSNQEWKTANNNIHRNAVSPEAIDLNELKLGWEYELGSKGDILFSTPAAAEQTVVLVTDRGWIVSLDSESGKERWSIRLGDTNRSSPTIEDGVVYLSGGADGRIYALDLDNGSILWNYETGTYTVYESPLYLDGTLYVSSGLDENAKVTALNAATGDELWSVPLGAPTFFGPSAGDGKLFIGSYDNQTLRALNLSDGSEVWSKQLTDEGIAARPVYKDGKLYAIGTNFDSGGGTLYALDANTGEELWRAEGIGDTQAASPIVYEDLVIMSSASQPVLRAFDKETGEEKWNNRAVGTILNNGSVTANGILFVTGTNGTLYALDVYTGNSLKEFTLPEYSTSGLPIIAGKLIVPYLSGVVSYQSPGILQGSIKDSDGNPVEGKVTVLETGVEVESDAEGNFTLEHKPGEYTLKVSKYGLKQVEETVSFISGFKMTKAYVLTDAQAGSLKVEVTDKRTQETIEGVDITLEDTSVAGTTNGTGAFTASEVFEGSYELTLAYDGYVKKVMDVTIESGSETALSVEMHPIDIAVLNDWNSEVTKLLQMNGYSAEERGWGIIETIDRYQVIYLNGAYGSGGEQPSAAQVLSLIDAAKEHGVNLIFADQWGGSYGTIEHLTEYLQDPKELFQQYDGGAVRLQVDVEHPIFAGYQVGDRMTLFDSTGDLTWFNQYSGRHLGSVGNTEMGIVGTGVAYKAVSNDSAHLLLSTHAAAPWISPMQGWLPDQQQILFNSIDFLRDAKFGSVSGTIMSTTGESVEAQIEILETGVKTETLLGEGSGAQSTYELFHDEGTYTMEIRASSYATETVEVTFTHGEPVELNLTIGASDGGTVTGIVTDVKTGQELEGAMVTITNQSEEVVAETVTATNGRYEFTELEEVEYTLSISKDGYVTHSQTIDVARVEGEINVSLNQVPSIAVVEDYWSDERNFASIFNAIDVPVTAVSDDEIADRIGDFDVVFFNDSGYYFNKSDFDRMMKAADEHQTSIIFGETGWSGSGIDILTEYRGDPETRDTADGSLAPAGYVVTEEHPIFNGAKEGDFIELLIPAASDIGYFEGYSGYPLADITHEGNAETHGTGFAYKPRTSGSMEVLMGGHGFYFSHDASEYTDEAKDLLVRTVLWAAKANFNTISGTVTDADGNPLLADVKVKGAEFSDQTNPEDGSYSIAILDGDYEVEVSAFGYQTKTVAVSVSENSETLSITLEVDQTVGSISGVVENERDGNAVEGAQINVLDVPREAVTTTQGHYDLERLMPGTYTLRIEKEGYVRKDIEIEVGEGENVELNISLKPSPTVGVIVDNTGSDATLRDYLEGRGYVVTDMTFTELEKLKEVDLVFANADYNNDLEPTKIEFKAFLKALDESGTSVIWTGQHGGRGSIRYLHDYLNDPAVEYSGSEDGTMGKVVEEHPITAGLEVGESFEIASRFGYYYGFDGYSGKTLVGFSNDATNEQGSMVAYQGRTIDSVEILLANMTISHVYNPEQSFDPIREKLLNNAILWALDNEEALVGELHGEVVNDQGVSVQANVTISESGKTIKTEADGTFFAGLEAGTYELTITAFGHEEKTFSITIENGESLNQTFELTADNAGIVSGIVKDGESGEPIADASVTLLGTPLEAKTDEQGRFRVSAPAEEYDVRVLASGYAPSTQANVQVVAGEEAALSFAMQVSEKIAVIAYDRNEERLVPFLEANGYDVDFYQREDFAALQEAMVDYQLIIFNDKYWGMTDDQFKAFVEKADELQVSIIFPSQWGGGTIEDLTDIYGDPEDVSSTFVDRAINVKVEKEHPIFRGYEVDDVIEILVREDASQQYAVYEGYSGTTIGSLTHNEEGVLGQGIGYKYRTANSVHVLLSGFQVGGYGSPEERWTEDAKQIYLNAIDFAITASLGEIRGTITDNEGNPVANAKVSVASEGVEAVTAADGTYRLGVGVGHYEVKVQARGFVEQAKEADVEQLGDAVQLNFTLDAIEGVTLSGTVADSVSGDPIEGVKLTLTPEDPEGFVEETTTDATGNYAFDHLLPGNYELKLEVEGYLPATETITITDDDVTKDVPINKYRVAVLGDIKEALVTFLNDEAVYAESRGWDVVDDIGRYEAVLVNTNEGTADQVEQLLAKSDEANVSVVFVGTWGVGEGSIQFLESVEGSPQLDQHGYDVGAIYIQPIQDHPIFEGLGLDGEAINIHTAKSPYATFKGYPGIPLANLSVEDEVKGSSIAYEFRSKEHMHLLLSSFAVTNIIGPEYGWTTEGKHLFVNALNWAMDAEQQLPGQPTWDAEELKFKGEPVVVTGKATPGTTVHVFNERGKDAVELGSVRTKPDGTFELELELHNGSYFLRAVAKNFSGEAESEGTLQVIVAGQPSEKKAKEEEEPVTQ
ncbi:carboxypeptidase regulatory-like domain-containing protein [Alkalihalobacillus sp. AL-G]|uniref:carboxypeptidase regulatory-like domain-containing protein n=1 Tax=Alkalihalobacillus sp. AL-G TaxID=2926399 RepID=UPI002729C854|nr:carboxypeptidase regulatory-like domain-containing protein [Alkalihalobacillus sp. AL-G]WLD93271.1 carboxypeptidase regulatory-like domain-containing protein [Alkalihalobacillus sp. AL-G]